VRTRRPARGPGAEGTRIIFAVIAGTAPNALGRVSGEVRIPGNGISARRPMRRKQNAATKNHRK